jgi:uncharacterized membrane protein YcaP (DUF421 family)
VFSIDWAKVFVPTIPILETVVRGTIVYLMLFAMLRFALRRQSATMSITDLLVIVLIADASQNAMSADYHSITDGMILVATIIFWSYSLDWLGYHVPVIGRLLESPPLLLVKDGRMLRRNMRRELVTPEELMSRLREEGVEHLADVERAYMEPDGRISVITHDHQPRRTPDDESNAR